MGNWGETILHIGVIPFITFFCAHLVPWNLISIPGLLRVWSWKSLYAPTHHVTLSVLTFIDLSLQLPAATAPPEVSQGPSSKMLSYFSQNDNIRQSGRLQGAVDFGRAPPLVVRRALPCRGGATAPARQSSVPGTNRRVVGFSSSGPNILTMFSRSLMAVARAGWLARRGPPS